jgi:hydrogenase nickel incorporation protein HypA/HybF
MHEIGIVRQILRTVESFAEKNGVKDIREVVVDCGELSLVIPKYLEELYPVVVKDSILKDSKLVINIVPGMAECDACDEIFNVVEHKGYCPNCGSFDKTILSGKEFAIREIVVPA